MTPPAAIAALASGEPGAGHALLPACRATAYGVEAFGPRAVAALFARNPAPLSAAPDLVVATPGLVALFDADAQGREQAWFADLHDGAIGRLWRLGPGAGDTAEPVSALAVGIDPFLSQRRDPVAFRAADHPDLAEAAIPALLEACAAAGRESCLVLVLRAASCADRGAALLAHIGAADGVRLLGLRFRFAAGTGAILHERLVTDEERSSSLARLAL